MVEDLGRAAVRRDDDALPIGEGRPRKRVPRAFLLFGLALPILGFVRYTDGTIPPDWLQIALSLVLGDLLLIWGLVAMSRPGRPGSPGDEPVATAPSGIVDVSRVDAERALGREPLAPPRPRSRTGVVAGVAVIALGFGAAVALSVVGVPMPSVGPVQLTWMVLPLPVTLVGLLVLATLSAAPVRSVLVRSAPLLGVLLSVALLPPAYAGTYRALIPQHVGAPWGISCKAVVVYPSGTDEASRLALLHSPFWTDTVVPLVDQLDRAGLNVTTAYDPAPGRHTGPPVHLFTIGSLNTAHVVSVDVDPAAVLTGPRRAYGVGLVLVTDDRTATTRNPYYVGDGPQGFHDVLDEQAALIDLRRPDLSSQVLRHALAQAMGIDPRTAPSGSAFGGRPWDGHDGASTFTSADIEAMRTSSGCVAQGPPSK